MNVEIRILFERFCQSKSKLPISTKEKEHLSREFLKIINQNLTQDLYLHGFPQPQADIPDLSSSLRAFLTKLPEIKDPILAAVRSQKKTIAANVQAIFESNLKLYQFVQNKSLQSFKDSPTSENLSVLAKEIDNNQWIQELTKAGTLGQGVDKKYNEVLNKFLGDLSKVRSQIESSSLSPENAKIVIQHLSTLIVKLVRRSAVGIELAQSALKEKLSFLCYVELLSRPEEKLSSYLRSSFVISQWDWLYDQKMLKREIFLVLRKKGASDVKKELNGRIGIVNILDRLIQNKWIDIKQIQGILKNSSQQLASKSLESLQVFVMKKEVGRLVQSKAKGYPDQEDILDRLSTMMKSAPALKVLYNELLGNSKSFGKPSTDLSIEAIRTLLGRESTGSANHEASSNKSGPFEKLRDKILPDKTTTAPSSEGIAEQIQMLQKQLLEGANGMDEIMSNHYDPEQTINFLEDKKILLPDTEQFFRRKLHILQQRVKEGGVDKQIEMLLGKWGIDIRNNFKLDTQLLKLQETLKQYEDISLTQEELEFIKNMDNPVTSRDAMMEYCQTKYKVVDELKNSDADKGRLASYSFEEMPAQMISLIPDILTEEPFYFTKEELLILKENLPASSKADRTTRESSYKFYEAFVGGRLFLKMVQWGLWAVSESEQKEITENIVSGLNGVEKKLDDWKKFKSVVISKKSISAMINRIPTDAEATVDNKGKKLINRFKNLVQQGGEILLKNITEKDVNYFTNSMAITEYVAKVHQLLDGFIELEMATKSSTQTNSSTEKPSSISMIIDEMLEMEFCDQRLELMLDELMLVLPEEVPIITEGKKLYRYVTGFEY